MLMWSVAQVDHTPKPGRSLDRAAEHGVETARLPLDRVVDFAARAVRCSPSGSVWAVCVGVGGRGGCAGGRERGRLSTPPPRHAVASG